MVEKEELIKDRLQKLAEKIKELGYPKHWARLPLSVLMNFKKKVYWL